MTGGTGSLRVLGWWWWWWGVSRDPAGWSVCMDPKCSVNAWLQLRWWEPGGPGGGHMNPVVDVRRSDGGGCHRISLMKSGTWSVTSSDHIKDSVVPFRSEAPLDSSVTPWLPPLQAVRSHGGGAIVSRGKCADLLNIWGLWEVWPENRKVFTNWWQSEELFLPWGPAVWAESFVDVLDFSLKAELWTNAWTWTFSQTLKLILESNRIKFSDLQIVPLQSCLWS